MHGDMHVRFGGRHGETYRRKAARRPMPSLPKNEIVIPEKKQFKDGESFYTNLAHEMTHSTGAENQLGRLKPTSFGSKEYAREELVAELSAALVAQRYGMTKHLKEDSASYPSTQSTFSRKQASSIRVNIYSWKSPYFLFLCVFSAINGEEEKTVRREEPGRKGWKK